MQTNSKEPKDWTIDEVLEWMRTSGLSYYRLGQITGMSAVIMSSYVQGKSVPKRETCIQIAEAIQRYEQNIKNKESQILYNIKNEPNDWTMNEVLEWLRTSGMSYYRLSQITGMSAVMVSAYTQGKCVPKRESVAQMARGIMEFEKTKKTITGYRPAEPQPRIPRDNPATTSATLAALADRLQYENQQNRKELTTLTARVSGSLKAVLAILQAAKKNPDLLEHIPEFDFE